MAIKPICAECREELNAFGAIILSPPYKNGSVKKMHLCRSCYADLVAWINRKGQRH